MIERKCMVFGEGGVGKTATTVRYVTGAWLDEYDPTIEDSYRKDVKVGEVDVKLDILDTAGQDELSSLANQTMRDCEHYIIIYDVNDKNTFDSIAQRLEKIKANGHGLMKNEGTLVLQGNKTDLGNRAVTAAQAEELINQYKDDFHAVFSFEASAKENENVSACFEAVAKNIAEVQAGGEGDKKGKKAKAKKEKKPKKEKGDKKKKKCTIM
eukprot:m.91122 g.91122  ORF g.91122 m.91122 type:complete len:211 (-) comp13289_c0_seq1:1062-1694(-)